MTLNLNNHWKNVIFDLSTQTLLILSEMKLCYCSTEYLIFFLVYQKIQKKI